MSDELEVLEPAGSSVQYRGEAIEVRPLEIGQVPQLVRKCRGAVNVVLAMDSLPDTNELGFLDLVMDLVGSHGEELYEGVAICVGREPGWVAKGNLDEFVVLATAVFEVNRDFFVQRLAPLLGAGRKSPPASGDGPTPSSS
ncbi:hypothetical protein [Arenimonas caeni]|uniref:Uncharacterized protein n=1 Tax=Arenimonas caeni TaxID=2058085 RepID=A0A2P6M9F6_9GAMM|nr:hypothetical protein [Arenimonas caeni]PRH82634.1 hypothetical protein C6N40_06580 [Arenimonas caeni]